MVPPVPETDLAAYKTLIEQRFANPKIGDTTRRLCLDGSNRQPKFILPTVSDRLRLDLPVEGLALVGALWCRYCEERRKAGCDCPERPELAAPAGTGPCGAVRNLLNGWRCAISSEMLRTARCIWPRSRQR